MKSYITTENSVKPKYEIDEYDLPSIEEVYDEIQFVMATLGYKVNDPKQTLQYMMLTHNAHSAFANEQSDSRIVINTISRDYQIIQMVLIS